VKFKEKHFKMLMQQNDDLRNRYVRL